MPRGRETRVPVVSLVKGLACAPLPEEQEGIGRGWCRKILSDLRGDAVVGLCSFRSLRQRLVHHVVSFQRNGFRLSWPGFDERLKGTWLIKSVAAWRERVRLTQVATFPHPVESPRQELGWRTSVPFVDRLHRPLLPSGISSTSGSQAASAQPNLRTVAPSVQVAVAAALIS